MRICFIAHGNFTHIDAYLDHFKERGHEVHFVALAPGPRREVPTHDVGAREGFLRLPHKWSYLPAMLRARTVIRRLAPDIVHAHYATSAGLAAWVCNARPWLVTAHGTDVSLGVKSPVWRILLRAICRHTDCVNAVSEELREMILSLGTSPAKIETFTLGIDTRRFKFSERAFLYPTKPLRFICTRRLEPVYDHATIIRSMAILNRRGIRFVLTIVGDGELRRSLEALAAELSITDRITFAGTLPNALLPAYLDEHDVFLSASSRDGTSLCLLEAMASGLYPVVSDIRANAEWIKHGRNGWLHKVADPESLANCIESLLSRLEQTREALVPNREAVIKRGDRAANMLRLEEIYCRLSASMGSARPSGHPPSRSCRAEFAAPIK
jgi:glycosyltransferase involved in cell wall biosynthesis